MGMLNTGGLLVKELLVIGLLAMGLLVICCRPVEEVEK